MRAILLALVLVALAAVPTASALSQPPVGLQGFRTVKLSSQTTHKTCTARSRSRSAVAKATGKLTTVACEQPPRAKVLLTTISALVSP